MVFFSFQFQSWPGVKHHWSDVKKPILLQLAPHALHQCHSGNRSILASYNLKDVAQIYLVDEIPGGFVVQDRLYGRLHMFASEGRSQIISRMAENAASNIGIVMEKPKAMKYQEYLERKFGKFR